MFSLSGVSGYGYNSFDVPQPSRWKTAHPGN